MEIETLTKEINDLHAKGYTEHVFQLNGQWHSSCGVIENPEISKPVIVHCGFTDQRIEVYTIENATIKGVGII